MRPERAALAGMVPPFAAMTRRFRAPPAPTSRTPGQVAVGPHEEPGGRVRQQVRDVQDHVIVSRQHRDDEHLVEQREPDQIEAAEAERGRRAKPSP